MIRFTAVLEEEGKAARALAYESEAESITLGRDSKCDFQIPSTTISRQHCRIYYQDATYIIQDLRSTHGTTVNGKKLDSEEKKVLNNGDVICLANISITVSIEDEEKELKQNPQIGEKTQALAAKAVEEILSGINHHQQHDEGPFLRVLNGTDEGTRFIFGNSNEWYMGRSKDCDFIINDPNISRRHAIIRKDWEGYYVEDLGSKNGVLVNDKKVVKRRFLRHRDEILIGPIKLLFVDPNFELLSAIDQIEGFENNNHDEEEDNQPSATEAPEQSAADIEPPVNNDEPSGVQEVKNIEQNGVSDNNVNPEEEELPEDFDDSLLQPVEEKMPLSTIAMIAGGAILLIGAIVLVLILL